MSLKYALLGFLLKKPMTGYDLERWISSSIDYFWPAQLSQIYRTLRQLEEEGMVKSEIAPQESRPDRRVYSATPEAARDVLKWLDELVTERDAIRVPFLLRFFLSGVRGVDDLIMQLRVLRQVYEKHAAEYGGVIAENLQSAKDAFPHSSLEALVWEQTRRAGEMYTAFWLEWLDETLQRLEEFKARPGAKGKKPGKKR